MKVLRTGRLTDRQAMRIAEKFIETHGQGKSSLSVADVTTQLPAPGTDEFKLFTKTDFSIDSYSIRSNPPKFAIHFRRGTSGTDFDSRSPSAYWDEIGVETQDSPQGGKAATVPEAAAFVSTIQKLLGDAPSVQAEEESAVDVLNAQFSQMNALLSDVTERVVERRLELEKEFDQRNAEMQRVFAERASQQEVTFKERSDALLAREAKLDDRQHMHARRDLRGEITRNLQARLQTAIVSKQSLALRYAVALLSLAATVGLGTVAYFSFSELSANITSLRFLTADAVSTQQAADAATANALLSTSAMWLPAIRGGLASFGAVAFLLYGISWLKRIYLDDVRTQRDLERYSVDINRASWAIETIMEAKSSGNTTMPDILIAGVTRHLFDVVGHGREDGTTDALAAVLRASAKAKIGPGGAEFELNNRGTSKLAKELEDTE